LWILHLIQCTNPGIQAIKECASLFWQHNCNSKIWKDTFICGFGTVLRLSDSCGKTAGGEGNDLMDYPLENYEGFDEAIKCTHPLLIQSKISNIFNLSYHINL
jgi:hypothetical protein